MTSGSRYLDYLPAVFQEDAPPHGTNWLGNLLRGYEAVLTGTGDPQAPGLEELLDGVGDTGRGIERLFDPGPGLDPADRAPDEFLEWLSNWVALTLRADVEPQLQRVLIARAIPLYRVRGTKEGLADLIQIYTTLRPTIVESGPALQIGEHSTVGVDTAIEGGPPHFFRVTIGLATTDLDEIADRRRIVTAIIDAEKPAHTYYTLSVETPTLQIGKRSRVGVDTLLGEQQPPG
jgi:phage tail-like protein